MAVYGSAGVFFGPHAQEFGRPRRLEPAPRRLTKKYGRVGWEGQIQRQLEPTPKGTRLCRRLGATLTKSANGDRPEHGVPHGQVMDGTPEAFGWIGLGSWTLNGMISRNGSGHHVSKVG